MALFFSVSFALPVLHDSTVTLSEEYRRKPIVLIFGSYTWPPFRSGVPEINRLDQQYGDRAAFYVARIPSGSRRRTHVSSGWRSRFPRFWMDRQSR